MESWEEAVASYARALVGGETTGWLNLGNVRHELGDLVGAMDAFREASRVCDTFGTVSLAFCLREQANLDQATAALGEAVDAGNETAVGVLACWEWNRTLDPALEPALRAGADFHPSARADLADLLRSTRRVEEARDVLEQGARLGEVESGCRWATCTPTSWPTTTRR